MTSDHEGKRDNEVGLELKYCEHCGGLYVRERGIGVYCRRCESQVADLPKATPKRIRIILPVLPQSVVEDFDFGFEIDVDDSGDFEAAGGVA
jgi:hypothetical protein